MEKQKKADTLQDLRFCQELMNRLVSQAERIPDGCSWGDGHWTIAGDIKRLRRELNEVRKKVERW